MTIIPRISTRGYYDRKNGKTLKKNSYFLYPKKFFDSLIGSREITIMIHGLRNDNRGAVAKVKIAKRRLRQLGYFHPVVGFSYDSNTTGAHLIRYAKRALRAGQTIAKKNGRNLGIFIEDFKSVSPETRIRLIGHSLGTQVILSTVEYLAKRNHKDLIESVYFFGASITDDVPSPKKFGKLLSKVVKRKIINYYNPNDEVLYFADRENFVNGPLGLNGASGKTIRKYREHKLRPKNHRFASYAEVLKSFP